MYTRLDFDGDPDSAIICTLYVANLLDPAFGGLGLRARDGDGGRDLFVTYDALSYTWGNDKQSRIIQCNDKTLQVTSNLFNALLVVRSRSPSFLWLTRFV
jgi:hypothetical protein